MYIAYCSKCNHFFCLSRKSNYCRECKSPTVRVPISTEEFFELSLNDRYKLAYKLTNKEQKM